MDHSVIVRCPEHGQVAARSNVPLSGVLPSVLTLTGNCGCSRTFGCGTRDQARCADHGPVQVVFEEECETGRNHRHVVLACGCQGTLWFLGLVSVFARWGVPVA